MKQWAKNGNERKEEPQRERTGVVEEGPDVHVCVDSVHVPQRTRVVEEGPDV